VSTDEVYSPVRGQIRNDKSEAAELSELLHQSAAQNQFAFRELYTRTSGNLLSVLMRILNSKPLAEDALQETYIKIWNNADSYKPELGTAFTWMTGIARNQAIDMLRKRRTREQLETGYIPDNDDFRSEAETKKTDSPLDQLADSEALSLCLGRLEENPRRCIVRAYCEGWSHAQLSSQMGSPLGTVKSWIRRGLISLRECLNEFS